MLVIFYKVLTLVVLAIFAIIGAKISGSSGGLRKVFLGVLAVGLVALSAGFGDPSALAGDSVVMLVAEAGICAALSIKGAELPIVKKYIFK